LTEESPTRPLTLYAACKLSLFEVGQQLGALVGMGFAWGRVFFPYGPGEHPRRAVPSAIDALLKETPFPATLGGQVRDYIYVSDVASALRILAEADAALGPYNICSGIPVTMRSVFETVGESIGRPELIRFGAIPYRDWDPPFLCGDNSRLRSLGWTPTVSLTDGVARSVAWWRSGGQLGRVSTAAAGATLRP
jgi:nucleoside-diphosphate-sugar epimerase